MDPNNTHEVIFWDNLYKLRPWLMNKILCQMSVFILIFATYQNEIMHVENKCANVNKKELEKHQEI